MERRAYQQRPVRYDYHLTETGRRIAEVLLLLMRTGDEARADDPPVRWHHGRDGDEHELDVEVVCRRCGEPASRGLRNPSGRGAP